MPTRTGGEATAQPLAPGSSGIEPVLSRPSSLPRRRVQTSFDPETRPSLAQQHQAASCDINNIVAKYQRTGAVDHYAKHGGTYGYVPAVDFREAMEIIKHGETVFADLPSSLRERFHQDPGEFLEFVQNPDNGEALADLGLVERPTAPTVQAPPAGDPPAAPPEA